ncbi:hypothetical protein [Lysinibacillus sp. NPDC056232]|uniref:hypothetical protein n=1 Tax=Lysinibacillus sp. NPDC056232 TaxID=3345756 RepID=UPI0035D76DD6
MTKIIYLDLNVFTYLQSPREKYKVADKLFYDLVQKLKGKYCFPYSQVHIFDLLKGSNEEYTKKDLLFIGKISDDKIIGPDMENNELILDDFPPEECYKISKEMERNEPDFPPINVLPFNFQVDMSQIKSDDFYYEYLSCNNGIMDSKSLERYMEDKYKDFMDKPQMYKKIREDILDILDRIDISQLNSTEKQLIENVRPMIACWFDVDEESLENNFVSAVKQYMKVSNIEFDLLSKQEQIQYSYHLLAIHPNFKDKIKNSAKNVVSNMVRDSSHLFYASKAKYFVTEDGTLVKKGNFIYKVLGIKTRVVLMSEFMQKFC